MRSRIFFAFTALVAVVAVTLIVTQLTGAQSTRSNSVRPTSHTQRSDHFDGVHFFNHEPTPRNQLSDFVRKMQPGRNRGAWREWRDAPQVKPVRRARVGELRVTMVNHASLLIQMDDVNIVTDPVWSTRLAPVPGNILKRRQPPGIRFEDLPPVDVVLVSHNHFDHMDAATLKRLVRRDHPRIIVGLGNSAYLRDIGIAGARDIDWWQSVDVEGGLRVTSVPARHWSARSLNDADRTLWTGFVIESDSGDVYFAGDTGYTRDFEAIREHYEQRGRLPFRAALLPIAPGRPHGAMASRHMNAADAVRAYEKLDVARAFGIHFGTFRQGDDGQDEPIAMLDSAVRMARRNAAAAFASAAQRASDPFSRPACAINFEALRNGDVRVVPVVQRHTLTAPAVHRIPEIAIPALPGASREGVKRCL